MAIIHVRRVGSRGAELEEAALVMHVPLANPGDQTGVELEEIAKRYAAGKGWNDVIDEDWSAFYGYTLVVM